MSTRKNPRDVLTRPAEAPNWVLAYGPYSESVVDVFIPAEAAPPQGYNLVVVIHGGFWRNSIDRVHARPMANSLRDGGFIVTVPEYRRAGENSPAWPHSYNDLQSALTHLIEDLKTRKIPVNRILVTGHSAGGHLSLLMAASGLPIHAVVALAPVADLREAERENLGDGAVRTFMGGGSSELAEEYALADPVQRLKTVSKIPILRIVHGLDDEIVPVSNSRSFVAAVPQAELFEVQGAEHFALIDPEHDGWHAVTTTILDALAATPATSTTLVNSQR